MTMAWIGWGQRGSVSRDVSPRAPLTGARARGAIARAAWRAPFAERAQLRECGEPRFDVEMVDLSRTGFRAATHRVLRATQRVWLTLPGFAAREAQVVWNRGVHYGFAFVEPLHPAVFTHIVAREHD